MTPPQRRKLAELQTLLRHHRIIAHGGDQTTRFSCPVCSRHLRRMLSFKADTGDRRAYARLNNVDARLFPEDPPEQPALPFAPA